MRNAVHGILVFIFLALFVSRWPANAHDIPNQMVCAPTTTILRNLDALGEKPAFWGVSGDGTWLQILFVNESTLVWTLVAIKDQAACMMAAGTDWNDYYFSDRSL